MPQPTTNSWPFEMKELPSADGHIGAAVEGACVAEDGMVADKPADAGLRGAEADGLEVLGITTLEDIEVVDSGALSGPPLELDNGDAPPVEAGMLVEGESDEIEASAELVVELESVAEELGISAGELEDAITELESITEELRIAVVELKDIGTELESFVEELRIAVDELEDAGTELENIVDELEDAGTELESMVDELEDAGTELESIFDELGLVVNELEGISTELEVSAKDVAVVGVGKTVGEVGTNGVALIN